jgi:hypothetical protein
MQVAVTHSVSTIGQSAAVVQPPAPPVPLEELLAVVAPLVAVVLAAVVEPLAVVVLVVAVVVLVVAAAPPEPPAPPLPDVLLDSPPEVVVVPVEFDEVPVSPHPTLTKLAPAAMARSPNQICRMTSPFQEKVFAAGPPEMFSDPARAPPHRTCATGRVEAAPPQRVALVVSRA